MARKSTPSAQTRRTASPAKGSTGKKVAGAGARVKKQVGDVLGISRARVPKDVPRATAGRGGRPKGIELTSTRRPKLKRAGVVGGVRGRGR